MSKQPTIETLDFDAIKDSPIKKSIVSLSIKGSIRYHMIEKMTKQRAPFPVGTHMTQASVKFYYLKRRKKFEQKKREDDDKNPLLLFTRSAFS